MTFTKEEAFLAAVRSDLKVFLQQAFVTIYPDKDFMDNWHIDAIVHRLELSIQGHQPRLIINLPPRQLKSFIASVALPAFILGMDPAAKIICTSYSDELAKTLVARLQAHRREYVVPALLPTRPADQDDRK